MKEDMSSALPGFEDLVVPDADRGGAVNLTAAKYTALTVMRDYPGTFKAAARALFKYNLPTRVVRDLFHMNGETVKGIRELVINAAAGSPRGDFLTKCRAASTKNIVTLRLLDLLQEKLEDKAVLEELRPRDIMDMLERIEPHAEQKPDSQDGVIDIPYAKPAESFEDVIDGLSAEKTRARQVLEPENGTECSTANDPAGCGSFQQICSSPQNKGFDESLSSGLSNDAESAGTHPPDAPFPSPSPAPSLAPGGGGPPGGARAPGGDH